MTITLSAAAIQHVQEKIKARGAGLGLRIKIQQTGCSGYAYVTSYADEQWADDHVFQCGSVLVYVDDKSYQLMRGTHIDYRQKGLNWDYHYDNPMAADSCGCGESFSLKSIDET